MTHLIFPIAKKESRPGYMYHPFLKIGGETLLQSALKPFLAHKDTIDKAYFICLQEQEDQFCVSEQLRRQVQGLPYELIILDQATNGPAETVSRGVRQGNIKGSAIVCDVDHSLGVAPLFEAISGSESSVATLSLWPLKGQDIRRWSVAAIHKSGALRGIAEKRIPRCSGEFYGVIGCHYFTDIGAIADLCLKKSFRYFSEALADLLEDGAVIRTAKLVQAEFFGDMEQIRLAKSKRNGFIGTILCDIDGTIIAHEDTPDYDQALKVLPGSVEKLREWMAMGYQVLLITARKSADELLLRKALEGAAIPFHRLIMELPSGPRFLINDRKPSAMLLQQAYSFEVDRNEGIKHLNLSFHSPPNVAQRFKGGSFAETLLIEDGEKRFVRKRVSKRENLSLGYGKLKRQYHAMDRFARLRRTLVPALYGEEENSYEYSYDMEYLPSHRLLSECTEEEKRVALEILFAELSSYIYSNQMPGTGSGEDWLVNHLSNKVYTTLDRLQDQPVFSDLINAPELEINGEKFAGLRHLLNEALSPRGVLLLAPKSQKAIHGDLTFENILFSPAGDVKLIDMDGADYFDAPELDIGKLLQSLASQYETWSHLTDSLVQWASPTELNLAFTPASPDAGLMKLYLNHASKLLDCSLDQAWTKSQFYLSLHLIRMVPFRRKVSEDQAYYAMSSAIQWMGRALNEAVINSYPGCILR